jgi:hypothetical protein
MTTINIHGLSHIFLSLMKKIQFEGSLEHGEDKGKCW